MKFPNPIRLFTLAIVAVSSLIPVTAAKASTFSETDIEQSEVIAVARPYGENKYDLLVIQQIANKNKCWEEVGSNPVIVNPLLLNFDFSGHCNRATDSNGYSIRIDGQDYGLDLLLRLVPQNGELVLVGSPRRGDGQDIVLGRTYGLQRDFMKIILEPGWKFSKRTYKDKVLGHFYFSATQAAIYGDGNQNTESVMEGEEVIEEVTEEVVFPATEEMIPDVIEESLDPQEDNGDDTLDPALNPSDQETTFPQESSQFPENSFSTQ
jgi:hypothetical protein